MIACPHSRRAAASWARRKLPATRGQTPIVLTEVRFSRGHRQPPRRRSATAGRWLTRSLASGDSTPLSVSSRTASSGICARPIGSSVETIINSAPETCVLAQTNAVNTPTSAKSWSRKQRPPDFEANEHSILHPEFEKFGVRPCAARSRARALRSTTSPPACSSRRNTRILPFRRSSTANRDPPAGRPGRLTGAGPDNAAACARPRACRASMAWVPSDARFAAGGRVHRWSSRVGHDFAHNP